MSVCLQIIFSDNQYKRLENLAKDRNITISQYIKDCSLKMEITFEDVWEELLTCLDGYDPNKEFVVSELFGPERWADFDKSTKLSLSKQFRKQVRSGVIGNVVWQRPNSSNVSVYKKTH